MLGTAGALAQSGNDAHGQDQSKQQGNPADASKENQRKADEFTEATQALNGGPAGNPECIWLGRRVVQLMYRDDLDTAFRHLDLYDRFGCPGGHVQAAFRCLTRFIAQIDDKVPNSLNNHVHACWINPDARPQAAAAAAPAPSPVAAAPQGSAPAQQPAPQASAPPRSPPNSGAEARTAEGIGQAAKARSPQWRHTSCDMVQFDMAWQYDA
ncbi:putative cyclic beta-1-3, beta-1-6-glucan synthesis regulatory protein, ndvD-like (modular protein) [Bradyrhizobium sp. STM 3843]|nr:putative cyclic beta-1-3, beta-1-6-glucan synthesis regulatory protein, ndvD-like (modular protein) [Bradyrhizobium sp. STM 3843]